MSKLEPFIISVERIRQLGSAQGQQMTSAAAEAFLVLYGEAIIDLLGRELKKFVEGKLR